MINLKKEIYNKLNELKIEGTVKGVFFSYPNLFFLS